MRFAFLSQTWPEDNNATISGSSVQVYYIAKELAARRYPVLVILSSSSNSYNFSEGNLTVITIPLAAKSRLMINPFWIKKVKQALRTFKPDIIYQRGKLPETIAASSHAKESNTLFLWVSNSNMSGDKWKFVKKRWAKMNKIIAFLPRLLEAVFADIIIERAIKTAKIIITQNEYQQEKFAENYDLKSIVLGSGHPILPYKRKTSIVPKVLWLANLAPVKRPWLFAELAEKLKDEKAEFIMAGRSSDPKILERVLNITNNLKNFSYVGAVSLAEGNALMEKASVFVITSEYEGLPNTCIQACIHGVPTISFLNNPYMIVNKYNIGTTAKSFNEMVKTLKLWINDTKLRSKGSIQAYKLSQNEYDISKLVDRLLEIINKR
jgi:glycosyltransferase involved in cell wall biosynthesis